MVRQVNILFVGPKKSLPNKLPACGIDLIVVGLMPDWRVDPYAHPFFESIVTVVKQFLGTPFAL